MTRSKVLLLVYFGLCFSTPSLAGDAGVGQKITEAECARCHAIGKEGTSPLTSAPQFRTFAQKWPVEDLQEALAEGISVGHGPMPEFIFEPNEITDLIALPCGLGIYRSHFLSAAKIDLAFTSSLKKGPVAPFLC